MGKIWEGVLEKYATNLIITWATHHQTYFSCFFFLSHLPYQRSNMKARNMSTTQIIRMENTFGSNYYYCIDSWKIECSNMFHRSGKIKCLKLYRWHEHMINMMVDWVFSFINVFCLVYRKARSVIENVVAIWNGKCVFILVDFPLFDISF